MSCPAPGAEPPLAKCGLSDYCRRVELLRKDMRPIVELSRALRKRSTRAEKALWMYLRNRRFLGLKFHRQHPIQLPVNGTRRYCIADFYCHALKLVIEVDGGIHATQQEYDALRTERLNGLGIHVMRFSNKEVIQHSDLVLSQLRHYASHVQQQSHPPDCPPNPPVLPSSPLSPPAAPSFPPVALSSQERAARPKAGG